MEKQTSHIAQRARPRGPVGRLPDDPVVLGVDVGGTHTKMAAFDFDGELLGAHAFDSQRVLAAGSQGSIAHEAEAALVRAGVEAGQVAAVGLAIPGSVSEGGSLELCPNIDLDLEACTSLLRARFPQARLAVLNDADAAVLGDCWRGSASEHAGGNVALVTLGTGVGAGFVFRGVLYGSAHGAAGEVGHLCVDPREQEPCSCGRAGCLEQYASAKGLVHTARREHAARRELASRTAASPSLEDAARAAAEAFPDARAVLDAAARRDPSACAALERFSEALGFGLSQIACVVDPDVLVLGGGLSERADLFLGAVRARYRACALPPCRNTPIVVSKLGNACGMYGAASRALDLLARGECSGTGERLL